MNKQIITIIIAIAVGALSFFGGMKYQESKSVNNRFGANLQNMRGQQNGQTGQSQTRRGGFRPVMGEIINQDENSITVKLVDGSSKIVLLSEKTTYNKAETATKTDLKKGERVNVFGTENTDGSVTAQNIQLNPLLNGMERKPIPTQEAN
ncbi:hypothetical protein COX47_01425 [Candidatus Roizmanbacteria bacterium CG23_combo_of_CG06-09_8_20_14_all_35_49]|uniref:Uncharacterized protein n=1 Tax=Candidatus Roizmanbacteria bacterium CG23_combo_of_CG06-09_8_20_14_all_35_49 TaxID=1974863 RepID=A0A2G9Y9E6_9BACT|nr:MAG: hypothetical protein COX47_01425 [Candidatus Roizmanbacteria bacterium CG23_combo_of_CG06-09_8_20_14_all_35_49]